MHRRYILLFKGRLCFSLSTYYLGSKESFGWLLVSKPLPCVVPPFWQCYKRTLCADFGKILSLLELSQAVE